MMSSSAEAEVGVIHHNRKVAILIRTVVIEIGHTKVPTSIRIIVIQLMILSQKH